MTTAPEPVTAQFTIGLDTVIGIRREYDLSGEYSGEYPETFGDRVAELVAKAYYQDHKDAGYDSDKVDAQVDKIIGQRVEAAFRVKLQPTDLYGQKKGEPLTMAELVDKRIAEWFAETTAGRDGYGRISNIRKLVDDAVGRALTADINNVLKAARDQVLTAFKTRSVEMWTEIMAKSVLK